MHFLECKTPGVNGQSFGQPSLRDPTCGVTEGECGILQITVELLFNLLWLALSVTLLVFSFFSHKRCEKGARYPTIQTRIIALAVLIVILLPAVSLTDDLQACTAPMETEHVTRRVDFLPAGPDVLHHAIFTVTTPIFSLQAARLQMIASTAPVRQTEKPYAGYLRRLSIRPPPAI